MESQIDESNKLISVDRKISYGVKCHLLSACVLIRTERGRFEEATKALKQLKGVKKIFPVLGRYDVVVDLETSKIEELAALVLRMGKISGVVFTETLVEIQH